MSENPHDPNTPQSPDGQRPPPSQRPSQPAHGEAAPYGQPAPQGPPPGYGPPPPQGPPRSGSSGLASDLQGDAKGLFGSLFDLSFTHYITPKIVRIVYVIGMVLIGLGLLFAIIAAFAQSILGGFVTLLFGWLFALLYLVMFRILLEFYTAVVSTAETIQKYAHRDGVS